MNLPDIIQIESIKNTNQNDTDSIQSNEEEIQNEEKEKEEVQNDEVQNDEVQMKEFTIDKQELISKQLKIVCKKKVGKKYKPYIVHAATIYDDIEDCILKGRPNKKIYKLFGDAFKNKKYMDNIITAIKQIVTNCDDMSEEDELGTVSEQISNHISGFSLNKNIIEPMSDISAIVKQHLVTSSINNINTIESYTKTIDNSFIQMYVNTTLRDMRSKCITHIN